MTCARDDGVALEEQARGSRRRGGGGRGGPLPFWLKDQASRCFPIRVTRRPEVTLASVLLVGCASFLIIEAPALLSDRLSGLWREVKHVGVCRSSDHIVPQVVRILRIPLPRPPLLRLLRAVLDRAPLSFPAGGGVKKVLRPLGHLVRSRTSFRIHRSLPGEEGGRAPGALGFGVPCGRGS